MLLAKVDVFEGGLLACSLMVVISDIILLFCVLICINAVANCACRSSWCIELLEAPVGTVTGGTFTTGTAAGGAKNGGASGGAKNGGAIGGAKDASTGGGHANATSSAPGGHSAIGVAKGASTGGGHNGVGAAKGTANGTGFGTGTGAAGFAFAFITVVQVLSSPASWSMLLTSEADPVAIFSNV